MTHKVLCFGGRDFADAVRLDWALTTLRQTLGTFAIIHGGARGADVLAGQWGMRNGVCVIRVDANWEVHGKGAGFIRNRWMLEICAPTYAVEFPCGAGTKNMRGLLDAANVAVWTPFK